MSDTINSFSNPNAMGWNAVATARIAATLAFLEEDRALIHGRILDIGGDSPMSRAIQSRFPVELLHPQSDLDLDLGNLEGSWDQIFSFEVIEHLGSPLRHLLELKDHINPGGNVWLSTPLVVSKFRPTHWIRGKHHIFEMDWSQLNTLIKKSDLSIERMITCDYLARYKNFLGFRTLIRYITTKCVILKLSVK